MGLCPLRMSLRVTEPRTVVEETLEGKNPRRAPTGDLGLAKAGVVAERTPGGSKASKRACRPFTGEPSVGGKRTVRATRLVRVEATGLATAGNLRPSSCVPGPPPGGRVWQRAGAIRRKRP
jgi:hypothetical protein